MSDTIEISQNDHNALNLMREKMQMEKGFSALQQEAYFFPPAGGLLPATPEQVTARNEYQQKKDRIEHINYALEAWSDGEDILIAMLRDPRAEITSGPIDLTTVMAYGANNAQRIAAMAKFFPAFKTPTAKQEMDTAKRRLKRAEKNYEDAKAAYIASKAGAA